jgi:hypothetical protein
MKRILPLLFILCFAAKSQSQIQPTYVGIPSGVFNYYSASQQNSNWCWAASIQMIFNYYHVNINQAQIVRRSYGMDPYGNLPNWTGSLPVITANLNNWNVDNSGRQYRVQAVCYQTRPNDAYIVQELNAGRPVLIGYMTGPNSGHAVVATACSYYQTPQGIRLHTIVVRDPWPSQQNINSMGRNEYAWANFAPQINAHWYVRVY